MKRKFFTEISNAFETLILMLTYLDQDQLNTKPKSNSGTEKEDAWTSGQIGDHLYKSYSVLETLNGKTSPANRPIDAKAIGIRETFLDFNSKMKSPEFIVPTQELVAKDYLLTNLKERTDEILEFVRTKDLSLLCLDFELPNAGTLTRLEWLHFISVHTQRHNYQLQNLIDSLPTKQSLLP